ncbi:hypothetical protein [Chryseobacterium sp. T20]|uniref:hypothetical protein n=1 Tax=Chryseobacterium sp. T20 TaxID=3395375 RepID=UPI0039BD4DD2
MKKYFKDYTEHLSAIILLFYILGFSYQFWYYQYFEIEIQYYVTLTDIIFESIGSVLMSALIFCGIELGLATISDFLFAFFTNWKTKGKYDTLPAKVRERADRYMEYLASSNRKYYSFTLIIISVFAGLFIFNSKLYFLGIIVPNLTYRMYRIIPKIDKETNSILKISAMVMIFFILVFSYSYFGFHDASQIHYDYSSKIIKTEKIYTGDNNYKYIGETSLYIFVLNGKTNTATIINKNSINEMNVEPNRYRIEDMKKTDKQITDFIDRIRIKTENK